MLGVIPGIGAPMESNKMHITMAILNIPNKDGSGKELEQVKSSIAAAMVEFKDMISRPKFFVGAAGLEIFTTPCQKQHMVSEIKLGRHTLALLRGVLWERLSDFITDRTWRPHITIFKRGSLSVEDQEKVVLCTHGVSFGIYSVSILSLRKKKTLAETGEKSFKFFLTDEECSAKEL